VEQGWDPERFDEIIVSTLQRGYRTGSSSTSRNRCLGGITLERSNRNRSVRDGEVGIYVAPGNRNVIAGNRVSHPFRAVRGQSEGRAIEVDDADHNVIARNSLRDTEGHAISLGFRVVVGTVVRRNRIRGAGEDEVHVNHKAKHTPLERNHAFGAKDDGLDANNPTTKLTREARRNADLGIEAVRGVIDGGGNVARHNGDPASARRSCVTDQPRGSGSMPMGLTPGRIQQIINERRHRRGSLAARRSQLGCSGNRTSSIALSPVEGLRQVAERGHCAAARTPRGGASPLPGTEARSAQGPSLGGG